jgi:hypothetical protein
MRLKLFAVAGLAMLLVGLPAAAQPSPRTMELARRYAAAVQMEEMMGSMMRNMMPGMMDQMAKQRGLTVNPELRIAVTEAAEESVRSMTPKMIDAMLPAIADTFSEAELQAAISYYESPPGKSLLAKAPTFMAKASPAMVALMPAMQADLEERLCKKIGCEPAKAPARP